MNAHVNADMDIHTDIKIYRHVNRWTYQHADVQTNRYIKHEYLDIQIFLYVDM